MKNLFKFLLINSLISSYLFANIAEVTSLKGTAAKSTNSNVQELKLNDNIITKDVIETGKKSRVKLQFIDGKKLTIRSNSFIEVSEYSYKQGDTNSTSTIKILKGVASISSGLIAKLNAANDITIAKNATIAVRGTEYIINTSKEEDVIACVDGKINVESNWTGDSVELLPGEMTIVKFNEPPQPPMAYDKKLLLDESSDDDDSTTKKDDDNKDEDDSTTKKDDDNKDEDDSNVTQNSTVTTTTSTNTVETTSIPDTDTVEQADYNITLTTTPVTTLTEGSVTVGTTVATSTVSDTEGGTVTYTLSGDTNGYFAVDSSGTVTLTSTGAAYVNAGNDLPRVTLTASSTSGSLSDTSSTILTSVSTTDVNDALILSVSPVSTITEDSVSSGTQIATTSATDEDGSLITYSLTNNSAGYFAIDSSGNVTLTSTGAAYVNAGNDLPTVTVNATSTTGLISTNNIVLTSVSTTDVNDSVNLSVTAISSIVAGSVSNGTQIATTSATDEDGSSITYSLTNNSAGYFAIDSSGNVTLTSTGAAYVIAGNDLPSITITATSTTGLTSSNDVTLNPTTTTTIVDNVIVTNDSSYLLDSSGSYIQRKTFTKDVGDNSISSTLTSGVESTSLYYSDIWSSDYNATDDKAYIDLDEGSLVFTDSSLTTNSSIESIWSIGGTDVTSTGLIGDVYEQLSANSSLVLNSIVTGESKAITITNGVYSSTTGYDTQAVLTGRSYTTDIDIGTYSADGGFDSYNSFSEYSFSGSNFYNNSGTLTTDSGVTNTTGNAANGSGAENVYYDSSAPIGTYQFAVLYDEYYIEPAVSVAYEYSVDGTTTYGVFDTVSYSNTSSNTVTFNYTGVSAPNITVYWGDYFYIDGVDLFTPDEISSSSIDSTYITGESTNGTIVSTLGHLEYTSWGLWATDASTSGSNTTQELAYWNLGVPVTNMPTSGTATYSGPAIGSVITSAGAISGIAGIYNSTVDFSTNDISNTLDLYDASGLWASASSVTGSTYDPTTQQFNNFLTGTGIDSNSSDISGTFYGPSAAEISGTFEILKTDGDRAIGSFAGLK